MRLTKYPQSCILIEHDDGGRLLIDPGNVAMDAMAFEAFGAIDAVLFTHRHADHCDVRAVDAIAERGLPVEITGRHRLLLDTDTRRSRKRRLAPVLVFTLVGGVIADRVERRWLLFSTQAVAMVLAFVLAAFVLPAFVPVP